jgi:nucleoside-diphosphate-sugar epimerase
MRHLVTGGLGFIGQHLVDLLLVRGDDVLIVDDNRAGNPVRDDCEVLQDTFGSWDYYEQFAAVWHLASPVGPVGVLNQAGRITGEVFRGAENAAMLAMRSDVPLIHVSTSEVYGGGDRGLCAEDMDCRVSTNLSARLEYQTAKLAVEVMLQNTDGLDARIIRPFNVSGAGQKPEGGFVLPRWKQQLQTGQALTVYAPGTQRRAMTHVHDIVEGMYAVWQMGEPGLWNLGNPDNVISMVDLADLFVDVAGGRWEMVDPIELHGAKFVEAAEKFPDATKAMSLGWNPSRSLREIVEDVLL